MTPPRDTSVRTTSPARGPARVRRCRRGRWSVAELRRLESEFATRDEASLARMLGRSVESLRRMARSIFEKRNVPGTQAAARRGEPAGGPWTPEDLDRLKRSLGFAPVATIAIVLARTEAAVESKIEELRRSRIVAPWSRDDRRRFKSLFGTRDDRDLAAIFSRTVEEVEELAEELQLRKDKVYLRKCACRRGKIDVRGRQAASRMPRWRPAEVERLQELYADHSNLEIATALGRSVKSVVSKAHDLRLRKSRELLERVSRRNVGSRYAKAASGAAAAAAARSVSEADAPRLEAEAAEPAVRAEEIALVAP